jgi:YHS domain-containing protein/positive regulator of sigma E activity
MSEEQGIVMRLIRDDMADVMTEKGGGCESCGTSHSCHACGTGNRVITRARNRIGAGVGDQVILRLGSGLFVKSAAVVYLLPIAGFIMGAVLGASLHDSMGIGERTSAVLFGLGGLGIGFLITVMVSRWTAVRGMLTPEIAKIISRSGRKRVSTAASDPVCNMLVDPAKAPASLEYRGKTYYFCNPGCKQVFAENPGRYIG